MKEIILSVVFLLVSSAVQAAPTCKNLAGTWRADIYDGPNHAVDKFIIQKSVSSDNRLTGKTESGNYMDGFCTNGVVYLYESFTSEKLANSYYFANEKNGFGQNLNTWADPSFSYQIDIISWRAIIKKVSASTTLNESPDNSYIKMDGDFRMLRIIEKSGSPQ